MTNEDLLPSGAELILASASPRRRQILSEMGLSFSVFPCEVDETVPQGLHPQKAVEVLAVRKAQAAARTYAEAVILASDTLVEIDAHPLGKPKNEAEAEEMLTSLSGREHRVHTGVALCYRGRILSSVDSTRVFMRAFDIEEIRAYVATGEPMDKAGSYGIQGKGGRLVDHIEGAYDTVVGLPSALCKTLFRRLLEEL